MWMKQGPLCVPGGEGGGDASESREFLADTAAHVAKDSSISLMSQKDPTNKATSALAAGCCMVC